MPRALTTWMLMASLGLSACGFTPLYGDTATGSVLTRIAVTAPDNRLGYRLREQLEDVLGLDRSQRPQWQLETQVSQSRRPLGRRIDDTATRYELTVLSTWTLTPVNGGAALTGTESVTTTYAAADQPYAAISAQQDGEERAAAELARRIRLSLMARLGD
ncbi:hypothetical protein GVN24_31635 [Rhizobium sp. CRIBSB]|nr:hypothetical protein [Rhizobium sp. CRIBSB]